MPAPTTGAGVPAAAIGALAAIGAPAAAELFGGRMATPGVTKKWVLPRPWSLRVAPATGAGFAAAAGAAFAAGIEKRRRRAWLGSMPKDEVATARAIKTRNLFFTVPPNRIAGTALPVSGDEYPVMIIGLL